MIFMENDSIVAKLKEWQRNELKAVLATVVKTWGSSPRKAGCQLAVNINMDIVGSVSGGCVEGAVIEEAIKVMEHGQALLLEYGVSDEKAWEVGLTCGGKVTIYLEKSTPELLSVLNQTQQNMENDHTTFILRTLDENLTTLVDHEYASAHNHNIERTKIIASSMSALTKDVWLQIIAPPLKLYIVGAVHVGQHLSEFASMLGLDVHVIDPRSVFATKERFKRAHLSLLWPDVFFRDHLVDQRSAIVTLSHDPKLDDPALYAALKSDAFYIGALGSKTTHEKRAKRLKENGISDEDFKRIDGPIGMALGGKSPSEIALSIAAMLVKKMYGGAVDA